MSNRALLNSVKVTTVSQVIVFAIMAIRVIIIPNNTSVEEFGLFQTYLLYLPYITFLALGFNDGFYLTKSKNSKTDFINNDYISPFIIFSIVTTIQFIVALIIGTVFFSLDKSDIVFLIILNIPVVLVYNFFTYYLQISNRITQYNLLLIVEKVLFVLIIVSFILFSKLTFISLVLIDLFVKVLNTILSLLIVRKEFFTHRLSINTGLFTYLSLCGIGFKIMIASFLSLVVFSLPRLIAEQNMDIISFSYFSFIFSIASIAYALFSAVSVVLFPHIMKKENLVTRDVFRDLSIFYSIFLPLLFILTLPIGIFIDVLVPTYAESVKYIGIVFFIISVNIKTVIVINTMYKVTLRKNMFLMDNLITIASIFVLNIFLQQTDLLLYAFTIFLVLKVYIVEILFRYDLKLYFDRSFILELAMLAIAFLYFLANIPLYYIVPFCCLLYVFHYKNIQRAVSIIKKR